MQRYKILHRTYYNFPTTVQLEPHTLRLRPRVGHELRIESSSLTIEPVATLRWQRDVEDNSVAIATFSTFASQLLVESEVIIQHFDVAPLDFLVDDYAIDYPFAYTAEDQVVLAPYLQVAGNRTQQAITDWIESIWQPGESLQTFELLQRLTSKIHRSFAYQSREEPGVQTPLDTLTKKAGSCRDFACLFMAAARRLGLASRFVSGYLNTFGATIDYGATHAWAEIYLPGVGWKGFDPTVGDIVGTNHIAVAVARLPESVPPIEGSYLGPPGASLDVGVWVTELT
jgi:transglutaminase-like putative cysteine protease